MTVTCVLNIEGHDKEEGRTKADELGRVAGVDRPKTILAECKR